MGSANAWIAGSYQSDFARNYAREGLEISDMVAEAVAGTLENARIGPEDVESIHVGNAFGQLFTGQGQLGAMPATVEPRLWGKPAARHEAACASGSVAVLAATAEIEAGRYDCILVLAVEQERNVPGQDAPKHLGAAAWIGHEGQDATFMWPYMFSQLADEYDRRYGLDNQHLHAIAELNMRNAKSNPLAQTRTWKFGPGGFAEDDHANPVVEGRLRRTDCAQVTDGVAGLLLVSDRFRASRRSSNKAARIAGWGHGTAGLPLQPKLDRSRGERYVFPHVRRVVTDAFRRAQVADDELVPVEDVDRQMVARHLERTVVEDPQVVQVQRFLLAGVGGSADAEREAGEPHALRRDRLGGPRRQLGNDGPAGPARPAAGAAARSRPRHRPGRIEPPYRPH